MKHSLIILLLPIQMFAASWYVDNAATGSRNGTSWANAWTNLANVTGIAPGDTVYISGGTTSKTYLVFTGTYYTWQPSQSGGHGTAGQPITYRVGQDAGHNGVVVFDGQNISSGWFYDNWRFGVVSGDYQGSNHMVVSNTLNGVAITADNSSDLAFDHISFYDGIRFNGATNIVLADCFIKPRPLLPDYCVSWQVRRRAGDAANYTNNIIRNCTLVMPACDANPAWGSDGIQGGECSSVYSNFFSVYYVTNNTEWQHTDGWQNLGESNCKIYGNTFENIANYSIFWEMLGSVSNVWIYNNVFQMNDTLAHAAVTSVAIVVGQRTPGSTISNVVVANNTVVDNFGRTGISLGDDVGESNTWTNIVVANNLLLNSGNSGEAALAVSLTGGGTNGFAIYNNKALSGARGTNFISPSQLVTPGGATTSPFVSYTERDPANDLHLASAITTAIDQGASLTSYFTTDKDGATRGATWDLGAYEYTGGGDVTSPSISITSPTNNQPSVAISIAVSGTSSDDTAVASVTLTNVSTATGFTVTGTTSWSATATLAYGSNYIRAIATDSSGNKATNAIAVLAVNNTNTWSRERSPYLGVQYLQVQNPASQHLLLSNVPATYVNMPITYAILTGGAYGGSPNGTNYYDLTYALNTNNGWRVILQFSDMPTNKILDYLPYLTNRYPCWMVIPLNENPDTTETSETIKYYRAVMPNMRLGGPALYHLQNPTYINTLITNGAFQMLDSFVMHDYLAVPLNGLCTSGWWTNEYYHPIYTPTNYNPGWSVSNLVNRLTWMNSYTNVLRTNFTDTPKVMVTEYGIYQNDAPDGAYAGQVFRNMQIPVWVTANLAATNQCPYNNALYDGVGVGYFTLGQQNFISRVAPAKRATTMNVNTLNIQP